MLIPSPRHTPADLALWRELEAADRAHGNRPQLAAKAERSLAVIREFVGAGPCYCGVSAGKDSVVAAALCRIVSDKIRLVHLKAVPCVNPDNAPVLAALPWPVTIVEIDYSAIDPRLDPETEKDRIFFGAFRDFGDRYVSGIRADESAVRKISLRHRGVSTARSCRPLGWWSVADVFGYLAANDLPVHPAYAMLGGGRWPRETLRVDELGGERGDNFGRSEWESEYYGDALR